MQYFGFDRPSFGIKTFGFGDSFSPLELFAGGKQGAWYDPSDKSTLFQDVAGTVPVTKDGDPVALMRDKSGNNNHATQSVSTARPVYETDGILHWLDFDGVDDTLSVPNFSFKTYSTLSLAVETKGFGVGFFIEYGYNAGVSSDDGFFVAGNGDGILVNSDRISIINPADANWFMSHKGVATFIYEGTGLIYKDGVNVSVTRDNPNHAYDINNITTTKTLNINSRAGYDLFQKNKVFGMIMFDGQTNSENKLGFERYLANKSGVTL